MFPRPGRLTGARPSGSSCPLPGTGPRYRPEMSTASQHPQRSPPAPRPTISFTAKGHGPVRHARRTQYRRHRGQGRPRRRHERAFSRTATTYKYAEDRSVAAAIGRARRLPMRRRPLAPAQNIRLMVGHPVVALVACAAPEPGDLRGAGRPAQRSLMQIEDVALVMHMCGLACSFLSAIPLGAIRLAAHPCVIRPMAKMIKAAAISSAPARVSTVPGELRPCWPSPRWTKKPPDWASTPASSSAPVTHCTPVE